MVRVRKMDAALQREGEPMILRNIIALVLFVVLSSCAGPDRKDSLQMPYEDRIQLSSIYIQSGKMDQAVPLLEDAVIQDKNKPQAWAMLGEISYSKGDLDGAVSHLQKALETGGDDPEILNNLAWIEMERGDSPKALTLVNRALALDPEPRYPYLDTRARILAKLGKYQDALTDARAARDLVSEGNMGSIEDLGELIDELEDLAAEDQ